MTSKPPHMTPSHVLMQNSSPLIARMPCRVSWPRSESARAGSAHRYQPAPPGVGGLVTVDQSVEANPIRILWIQLALQVGDGLVQDVRILLEQPDRGIAAGT